ncbi:M20/M25/M40 family metallo-hydrolase [Curvibacter sp. HBC61]|uniref:M20/M25/M40 family metallo-hydrolase n=1 Tax=Curvibacter cyanobacteriorum TaxID=3026422 RepID=A0ABT5MW41_9BURK|nr:M20/M25/M40 family metallo-hydrolase [Curvibacter sp. HBC61]MDD0838259.1 M20/M25/M40 family metallo-hydrolase [Curvibacter sp. HBC61]
MFIKPFVALALVLVALSGAAQAQLSDTEQKIVAAVQQRSPAALVLLEKAVRINSGTLNPEGVRAVGDLFRAELDALGFQTRWIDMPPAMKRAGHLVATHDGGQGQRLLLLGHLDTVFEKSSAVPLWERHGDWVRGQGVNDMKGGDVILLEALRALQAVGALAPARIDVMLTGDEERTGRPLTVARADLVALAKKADYALSFESSHRHQGTDSVSIARRAAGGWVLRVKGKPGHSMGVFSSASGHGAVYEAARILNAFREQVVEPHLTFNPGLVYGGTEVRYAEDSATATVLGKSNVIARDAEVRGDLRYLSPEQGERARQKMQSIVTTGNLPGTSATIRFTETYPPMPPTEAGQQLAARYSQASQDAGLGRIELLDPGWRGAGDVQFVAPYTVGIDGLGAQGRGAHTDDEALEIASIERGAIRAALLIYRLTRPAP